VVETTLDDESTAETRNIKPAWFIGMLAVLALVLILIFTRPAHRQSANIFNGETAETAYARILGETRTGIRLARLEDFLSQYPLSLNRNAARVQARALRTRENMAWATLTNALYDLKATDATKTKARAVYIGNWGALNRPAYFNARGALNEDTQSLTFAAPRSRFNKDTNEQALAGSAGGRTLPPRPRLRPQAQIQTPLIIKASVKTARRPAYPRKARRRGVGGAVTLALDIDIDGRVTRSRVISFQGRRYKKDFIKSARRAASRSRFHPKTVNGRPVPTIGYLRQYTFDMDGS